VSDVTLDTTVLGECFEDHHTGTILTTKECIEKMAGKKYFTNFDLIQCFFQFPCDKSMLQLYAFSTPYGAYEYCEVLPQGDKNVPVWVNSIMIEILEKVSEYSAVYFDDINAFSDDWNSHLQHVENVLEALLARNVKCSIDKIQAGFEEVETLGFLVNKDGFRPKDAMKEKFLCAPFPTKALLKSWFGLLNQFRDFCPEIDTIDKAFESVRKKDAIWKVTDEMKEAFDRAKLMVCNIECLSFPKEGETIFLDTDASEYGSGGVLYHETIKGNTITKTPIRFTSHLFSAAARKWSTTDQECYAIIKSIASFEPLLFGRPFTIRTDHRNLLWMKDSISPRVTRWGIYLEKFEYTIQHVKGSNNLIADALSRIFLLPPVKKMTMAALQVDPTSSEAETGEIVEKQIEDLLNNAATPIDLTEETEEVKKIKDMFEEFHNKLDGHLGIAETVEKMLETNSITMNKNNRRNY